MGQLFWVFSARLQCDCLKDIEIIRFDTLKKIKLNINGKTTFEWELRSVDSKQEVISYICILRTNKSAFKI